MITTFVIPCGGSKLDQVTRADELYTGAMFRHTLEAARACAAQTEGVTQILILSAKHGLLKLDDYIGPYDQKMGAAGCVTAEFVASQVEDLWIGDEVYCFLPSAYFKVLDKALRTFDIYAQDVYETCEGIGEQRHVNVMVKM